MLRRWLDEILALLLPRDCVCCGRTGGGSAGVCVDCYGPLSQGRLTLRLGLPVARGWALGTYDGPLGALIRATKYGGDPRIARHIGDWLGAAVAGDVDVVTHVPCRWTRLLARGFDPAALMAEAVARRIDRPHRTLLRRRAAGSQVGRTRSERRALDPDAFEVRQTLPPLRVLLVDDVVTTGATARVCAGRLRDAGAAVVFTAAAAQQTSRDLS